MKLSSVGSGLALVAALLLVAARPALGDNVEEARRHYAQGTKAYEIGAYDEAIKEYGEAYRLIDDPALLFNLGQAHRLAGHTVEALRVYRMFLIKVPNTPNRAEVEDHISELQGQVASQSQPAPSRPASNEPAAPAPNTPAPNASTSNAPTTSTAPQAAAPAVDRVAAAAARKKLIAGGVITGAGVLVAVGGIVSGVLAQNAGNSVTHAAQTGQSFDYGTYHAGQTEQVVEIALLAIGGAAVVAGVTVMVLGKRQSTRAHAWIQPLLGPATAGFALAGSF